MKSTGMIRKIDDLGRIVIPKEIRKNMRIKNGDSLEIFLNDEDIVLKKYSPIETLENVLDNYVDSFNQVMKHNIIVTDRDRVIAIAGSLKKKYIGKSISDFTDRSIERRDSFVERQKKNINFFEDISELCYYSFCSIVNNGDAIGSVIILSTEIPITDSEEKMAIILSKILSKHFVD